MSAAENGGKRPLIAGNWKMNGSRASAAALVEGLLTRLNGARGSSCEVLLCPPAPLLGEVALHIAGTAIALGAQDCHAAPSGAHTGDVSAPMLADVGCRYVIVGHSERRADHGEDDAAVLAKAEAAREAGLVPIVCLGETLAEREAGRAEEVVAGQLQASLPAGSDAAGTVVAYEPVWAIGTGRTPTAEDIAAMHARIRAELAGVATDAPDLRILYGGSVKGANAREILAVPEVDGALVGGASLDAEEFAAICASCP